MGWLSSENLNERESARSPSTLVLCEDIVNRIGSERATRCREFRGDYGWRGSAGSWGAPGAKAPLPRLSDTALKGRSSRSSAWVSVCSEWRGGNFEIQVSGQRADAQWAW